ncbi:MAG: hypothetical protein QXP84_07695 [Candidatus Korarchaeum sp.]
METRTRGRKRNFGGTPVMFVGFYCPYDLFLALERIREKKKISRAALLAQVLSEYVERAEKEEG